MPMANENSASEQFSELRRRAENALPKRPSDNLEFMQVLKKMVITPVKLK